MKIGARKEEKIFQTFETPHTTQNTIIEKDRPANTENNSTSRIVSLEAAQPWEPALEEACPQDQDPLSQAAA